MRKVYSERFSVLVKEIADQPECKFIALVEDIMGTKAAIQCDGYALELTPGGKGAVQLLRENPLAVDKKKEGRLVCAFSSELKWVLVARDCVDLIKGSEWEAAKLADSKDLERLTTELYGNDVTKVLMLPDGRQVMLPADEGEVAAAKSAKPKTDRMPYDDSALYK